jgi:hypothetical protein
MVSGGPQFAALCPGGVAAHGAPPSLAALCKPSLIWATRQGILVTILFYAWGAFHYLLGSFGLAKRLATVAAERKAREA